MTSIEAIMVTLIPTLNISLYVVITLKAIIQNKMFVVEFCYNKIIVFGIYNSEAYDIVKLCLILVSSQLKLYSILMYLVKVNLLIYSILILFSDIKMKNSKKIYQYIKINT